VILDFNRSNMLTETARDRVRLREESERMGELLKFAMSKKDPWEGIPKETLKLLS